MGADRKTVKQMVADANSRVKVLSAADAIALHGRPDTVFVDLRDVRELAGTGRVAGARHVPRGMLEFWIDPDSPYHKDFLWQDRSYVFYCASGWRSALSALVAQEMGMGDVAHVEGGFTAWRKIGGPIDEPEERG